MVKKVNIMDVFMESDGRWFHLRELARTAGISPRTAKKMATGCIKPGLLEQKRERNLLLFRANRSSEAFRLEKTEWNLRKIRDSGILGYLDRELNAPCIVLFGSWSRGENTENSDIDLFVLSESARELDLDRFESRLGARIQLFRLDKKEFRKLQKKSPELAHNIINGRILSGYLDAFG